MNFEDTIQAAHKAMFEEETAKQKAALANNTFTSGYISTYPKTPCPTCGSCPTCGRHYHQPYYYPYPYYCNPTNWTYTTTTQTPTKIPSTMSFTG